MIEIHSVIDPEAAERKLAKSLTEAEIQAADDEYFARMNRRGTE